MAGLSNSLQVGYIPQPTDDTCQSTVLKMVAVYLEDQVLDEHECKAPVMVEKRLVADLNTRYHPGGDVPCLDAAERLDIGRIKHTINGATGRPDAKFKNSHANMMWWLESRYAPELHCDYFSEKNEAKAIAFIVRHIDAGFPVIASVSHAKVEGHIVLVVGYENYTPHLDKFKLIIHDPYGEFDPSLYWNPGYLLAGKIGLFGDDLWGPKRLTPIAGQYPGQFNHVPVTAASRHRPDGIYDDKGTGNYRLVLGRGSTVRDVARWIVDVKAPEPKFGFEEIKKHKLTNDPARGTYYLISFGRGAKQSWWSPNAAAATQPRPQPATGTALPGKPPPIQVPQKFPAKQSL